MVRCTFLYPPLFPVSTHVAAWRPGSGGWVRHGRVVLELVVGVGALLEEDLHHIKVGAGEAQGRVVIGGSLLVDIRATDDEELHCAEVTRSVRPPSRAPTGP